MPQPTRHDWEAARAMAEDPKWYGVVQDACITVILAVSNGWEVNG